MKKKTERQKVPDSLSDIMGDIEYAIRMWEDIRIEHKMREIAKEEINKWIDECAKKVRGNE